MRLVCACVSPSPPSFFVCSGTPKELTIVVIAQNKRHRQIDMIDTDRSAGVCVCVVADSAFSIPSAKGIKIANAKKHTQNTSA